MHLTPMQRRYQRFPRLMFHYRRLRGVNYEREMELLDVLCDRTKTSVDVGCKLGMYTYRLLPHSRDVVSFEPIPVLIRFLQTVFAKKKVRVMGCALSDAPGRTTMRVPFGSNGEVVFGRSTIEPNNSLVHGDVATVEEIDVEMKTLDGCALEGVGFIKIDVEGHELAVLRGAAATLDRDHPTLLIESNDHHHPQAVAKLRAFTTAHGYRGYFIEAGRLVELETVQDDGHFQRASIENFIFVHTSRADVSTRLTARFKS